MTYSTRTMPNFEVDALFLEELTQLQIKYISRILAILGRYMLLRTDMLYQIYEDEHKESLGLSYIKKAVKEKLLIEYQFNLEERDEQNVFFYALKESSYYALNKANKQYYKIPFFSSFDEKQRILTYNQFLINNNLQPNLQFALREELDFFVAVPNIICYFEEITSKEYIISLLKKPTNKDFSNEFIFQPMQQISQMNFGQKTRATNPKNIY